MLLSSKDSDAFYEKYKKEVGKDVVGTIEANYWNFQPTADGKGTKITHVSCSNPNGSIPSALVNKMAQKQAEAACTVSRVVKKLK